MTPSYVNEENTSIFLNSIAGLFFPSCHTHHRDSDLVEEVCPQRLENLLMWQKKIFKEQVIYFNTGLLIVIIGIIILVTSVESFNYDANLLSPFWFTMASVFLILMMVLTILLALEPDMGRLIDNVSRIFKLSCSTECGAQIDREESVTDTVHREDNINIGVICKNSLYCLVATVIVFIPTIIGLLIFKYHDEPNPYIYLIEEDKDRSSILNMSILTAFTLSSLSYVNSDFISGTIDNECFIDANKSFKNKIIVINQTRPECSILTEVALDF